MFTFFAPILQSSIENCQSISMKSTSDISSVLYTTPSFYHIIFCPKKNPLLIRTQVKFNYRLLKFSKTSILSLQLMKNTCCELLSLMLRMKKKKIKRTHHLLHDCVLLDLSGKFRWSWLGSDSGEGRWDSSQWQATSKSWESGSSFLCVWRKTTLSSLSVAALRRAARIKAVVFFMLIF